MPRVCWDGTYCLTWRPDLWACSLSPRPAPDQACRSDSSSFPRRLWSPRRSRGGCRARWMCSAWRLVSQSYKCRSCTKYTIRLVLEKRGITRLIKENHAGFVFVYDKCRNVIIRANTTLGQNSFLYKTIPDWNHLPSAAIESRSIAAFESQLSYLSGLPLGTSPLPDTPLRRTTESRY